MEIETKFVHGSGNLTDKQTGAMSPPIYQSATFKHPALGESTGFDYSREKNPTRSAAESLIASIENAKAGFAFASGMAAVTAVFDLLEAGSHCIVCDDLYGGTYRYFDFCQNSKQMSFSYVKSTELQSIENLVQSKTKAVFLETPSNPMMNVWDIPRVAEFCQKKDLLLIVDNTFLTPYFQRPLELGADIVLESGTKFLAGHNDTIAGIVAVNDSSLAERLAYIQKTTGAILSAFDSWLLMRGIKTLGIRMDRAQENAMQITHWLVEHPKIQDVYYVGLESHPGYEISKKQSSGFGAMISFTVDSFKTVQKVLNSLELISFAESLGGVETLITHPAIQTHAAVPEETRKELGISDTLLRLSVGIESSKDLIRDLENALRD